MFVTQEKQDYTSSKRSSYNISMDNIPEIYVNMVKTLRL